MNKLAFALLWLLCGFGNGFFVATIVHQQPTNAQLQIRFDAMNACMKNAGRFKCSMTIDDFVEYYDIKQKLEKDNDHAQD